MLFKAFFFFLCDLVNNTLKIQVTNSPMISEQQDKIGCYKLNVNDIPQDN